MNRNACNCQSVRNNGCSGRPNNCPPCPPPMPRPEPRRYSTDLGAMNQEQLLTYINQVSFVVSDMLLYLDTHPTDREALAYCEDHIAMRNRALKEYAALYGPLTIDTADDASSECWEWVNTPWPWEGRLK